MSWHFPVLTCLHSVLTSLHQGRYALFSAFSLSDAAAGFRTCVHSDPLVKSPFANNWCIQALANVIHLALIGHAISCIIPPRSSFTCISETAWLQTAAERPKFCCYGSNCCWCCSAGRLTGLLLLLRSQSTTNFIISIGVDSRTTRQAHYSSRPKL